MWSIISGRKLNAYLFFCTQRRYSVGIQAPKTAEKHKYKRFHVDKEWFDSVGWCMFAIGDRPHIVDSHAQDMLQTRIIDPKVMSYTNLRFATHLIQSSGKTVQIFELLQSILHFVIIYFWFP